MASPGDHAVIDRVREVFPRWLASRLGARNVELVEVRWLAGGFSNQTWSMTLVADGGSPRDLVVRWAPPDGVLAPYDIEGQYRTMRALAGTSVPVPTAHWYEPDTTLIGTDFLVMDLVGGTTMPRVLAPDDPLGPTRLRRYVEMLAAIHAVPHEQLDLSHLPSTTTSGAADAAIEREAARYANLGQRSPLLEEAFHWLRERRPAGRPAVALTHGDPNLSNYRFDGGDVVAVLDWELAAISDPLADLGYYCGLVARYYGEQSADFRRRHLETMLGTYVTVTGRDLTDLPFWEALFYVQGVYGCLHPAFAPYGTPIYAERLSAIVNAAR